MQDTEIIIYFESTYYGNDMANITTVNGALSMIFLSVLHSKYYILV